MHALIIEDELLIALDLSDALKGLGYGSVALAATQEAAIAEADRCWPDLITADFRLAAGTGLAAVQAVCARRPTAVVFVTGTPAEIERACPDAIIVDKPFSLAALAAAIPWAQAKALGRSAGRPG